MTEKESQRDGVREREIVGSWPGTRPEKRDGTRAIRFQRKRKTETGRAAESTEK